MRRVDVYRMIRRRARDAGLDAEICCHTFRAIGITANRIPKPKWMRWRTYDRKLEEIFAAEDVVDAHLLGFIQKLERLKR
jgi:hypothetical protein